MSSHVASMWEWRIVYGNVGALLIHAFLMPCVMHDVAKVWPFMFLPTWNWAEHHNTAQGRTWKKAPFKFSESTITLLCLLNRHHKLGVTVEFNVTMKFSIWLLHCTTFCICNDNVCIIKIYSALTTYTGDYNCGSPLWSSEERRCSGQCTALWTQWVEFNF